MNSVSFDPRDSSMLKRIKHDPNSNTLTASFKNGSVYAYEGVPQSIYFELLTVEEQGDSVGHHFIRSVKNAGFQFRKLEQAGA